MKYLLLFMLFTSLADLNAAPAKPAAAQAQAPIQDPVVLKMHDKDVKLSQILPMLIGLVGGNLNSLSKEQLTRAIDMAKKMYVMQEILSEEAAKQGYEKNPKYAPLYERAKLNTSIDILMRETGAKFSESELKKAYPKFANSRQLTDYKFSIILVNEEATAKSIVAGLTSGSKFEDIAKAKSVHRSADRQDYPGLIEFSREDNIGREFGSEVVKTLKGMSVGDLTKTALHTADGKFAIIRFGGKRKSAPLSFDELKPMIAMNLTNEKFVKIIENAIKSGKVQFFGLDGKPEPISSIMPNPAKA